ncbi:MAG: acyl-CoA thioesterase [Candidatus Nanopelagicales bacterium]
MTQSSLDPAPAQPDPVPAAFSRVTLARVMGVTDANLLGNVHGGVIMHLVDTTAGSAAGRHCGMPAVTAFVDELAFLEPVRVGDILTCQAQVNWTGRTSMEVGVRVSAQPWNDARNEALHVASAYLVFVAIGPDGRPLPVPPVSHDNDRDRLREHEAEIRRTSRLERRRAIHEWRASASASGG